MFNKITVLGNTGRAVEVKTSKTGTNIATFSVACTVGWGDNKQTDWYNVTAFGKLAEYCQKALQDKGALVCVCGQLKLNEYTSKNGEKKISPEITADSVLKLSRNSEQSHYSESTNQYKQPQETQQPDTFGNDGEFDEDCPF